MENFGEFIYEDYFVTKTGFGFRFSMGEHIFTPTWEFGEMDLPVSEEQAAVLDYAVFGLGMAEMISYWKAACPPVIRVKCGFLDDRQTQWWKRLFRNGLGEFFYRNRITPPDNFVTIIPDVKRTPKFNPTENLSGAVIPVGGGKDSAVTMELLKKRAYENTAYMINGGTAAVETAKLGGFSEKNILNVTRHIDGHLLELNARGFLNGHTPFSAIVAFSSFIFALLKEKKYIILSNESSADEGNTEGVNHQYSKSSDFEEQFRNYTRYCFGNNAPEYFSLLRAWDEWRITEEFVKHPQYFGAFRSCNVGSKTGVWCKKCPKCLYVCVMLSAFLGDETLKDIFGADLLNNTDFAETLESLSFPENVKPFECVGTYGEVRRAIQTAYENRLSSGKELPALYKNIYGRIKSDENLYYKLKNYNNFIPNEYKKYAL